VGTAYHGRGERWAVPALKAPRGSKYPSPRGWYIYGDYTYANWREPPRNYCVYNRGGILRG
jgi:hypothetical protein